MKLSSLSVVIPAFNDAATIEEVIVEAVNTAQKTASVFEIICIDDGSTDTTLATLRLLQKRLKMLTVIKHPLNLGYGKTIKQLYTESRYDWVFSVPGDHQVGAGELPKLIPFTKNADCIIGWRKNRRDPPGRLVQSALYNSLIQLLFGLSIHDINSVRLMRKDIISRVVLHSESAFVDAELTIIAIKSGFSVTEVPISHRPRVGSVGGGGKWWTILPTIAEMMRYWFRLHVGFS